MSVGNRFKTSCASEYMLDDSIIKKAKEKELLCLKDNYVLVEMSYISAPINLYEIIYEICINGYIPVLAHPERYIFIDNFKEYYKLKKFGCLFQLNLLSATGYYGNLVKIRTDELIEKKLIDFVGSDIHTLKHISSFDRKVQVNKLDLFEKAIERNSLFY